MEPKDFLPFLGRSFVKVRPIILSDSPCYHHNVINVQAERVGGCSDWSGGAIVLHITQAYDQINIPNFVTDPKKLGKYRENKIGTRGRADDAVLQQ